MKVYEDVELYIEKEDSEIPWLKIFTKEPYKELGDIPKELRVKLWEVYDIVEAKMIKYYKPTKINMASFGNEVPRVHIHVIARFKDDAYYPNTLWGEKLRDSNLNLPDESIFLRELHTTLSNRFSNLLVDRRKSGDRRRRK